MKAIVLLVERLSVTQSRTTDGSTNQIKSNQFIGL